MENSNLDSKIIEAAHLLGEAIKDNPVTLALRKAEAEYSEDSALIALMTEYNVQQTALTNIYTSGEQNENLAASIDKRLGEIVDEVNKNEAYKKYVEAKNAYDEFFNQVNSELQFAITGEYPCTHDCSSCHGCH